MNTPFIASKPTNYNGYHFRSRLEARWAVFFEAMSIQYRYEYEDFMLPGGTRYLPDFYFPQLGYGGCFGEVKHQFTEEEVNKCEQLCRLTKRIVLLLEDVPDFKCVAGLSFCDDDTEDLRNTIRVERHPYIIMNEGKWENKLFVEPGWEDENGYFDKSYADDTYTKAVMASRYARFEFERENR